MTDRVNTDFLEKLGEYQYGFKDEDVSVYRSERGLSEEVVRKISSIKGEPEWMLEFRLKALKHYQQRPMPTWGADIAKLDLDNIFYYVKPSDKEGRNWDEVPDYD